MNRLLYCAEILGVILTIMQSACAQVTFLEYENSTLVPVKSETTHPAVTPVTPKQYESTQQSSSRSPVPQPTSPLLLFFKKECLQVVMVCGGLIIACTLLLVLTLILLLKVCRLSRRLKSLSTSGEQIGVSEYRVRTAETEKLEDEVKETDILIADMSQNKTEISNGTAKEDGQEVKEKKVEDTPQGDEASPAEATTESSPSPSSKLQKEATDSEPTTSIPVAPASESTEEPKGVE